MYNIWWFDHCYCTYQCDIEVHLQFKDAEVGSRGEGRTAVCDGYVGRVIG